MALRSDVQLRALQRIIIEEGRMRPGMTFWASRARALQYIEQHVAEPIGAAGPKEAKPMEPAEKKSSSAVLDGRSTASAKSSAPGTAQSLFSSLVDQASTAVKSTLSKKRIKKAPAA